MPAATWVRGQGAVELHDAVPSVCCLESEVEVPAPLSWKVSGPRARRQDGGGDRLEPSVKDASGLQW